MKTIIAAFSDGASAQQAIEYLRMRDISDVEMLSQQDGNIINRLDSYKVPAEQVQLYAEAIRRGAPLLIAHTDDDDDANSVAAELDRMGSLDLDELSTQWRAEGWRGDTGLEGPRQNATEGSDLDVIEERVAIGKREVDLGGVRLRTFVTERPVHKQVELHEERIDITREPVDERISAQAADSTFTEDELVVTARGEEVVVGKEARVVERVHVGKTTDTRTETVSETERRRDVEVEQLKGDDKILDDRSRR